MRGNARLRSRPYRSPALDSPVQRVLPRAVGRKSSSWSGSQSLRDCACLDRVPHGPILLFHVRCIVELSSYPGPLVPEPFGCVIGELRPERQPPPVTFEEAE